MDREMTRWDSLSRMAGFRLKTGAAKVKNFFGSGNSVGQ
jgi:hypothetical protein